MKRRALVPLAAFAALLLAAGPASAEEDQGVRLRVGLGLQGGLFVPPGHAAFVAAGAYVQAGVQFNDLLALYVLPQFALVFDKPTRNAIGAAALVEFSFGSLISIGAGPDLGRYGQDNTGYGPNAPVYHTSGLYGGMLRVSWHPVFWPGGADAGESSPFKKVLPSAIAVNLDVHLLRGHTPLVTTPDTGSVTAVLPMLSVGFETH